MNAENGTLQLDNHGAFGRVKSFFGGWRQMLVRYLLVVIMLVFMAAISLSNSEFLTFSNMGVILSQVSTNALLATGATFVILTGGIDLSVGSIVGLTGVIAALVAQQDGTGFTAAAVIAALTAGAAIGAVNGILIAFGRLPAFVTTLGTMTVMLGVASVISDGQPISGLSTSFLGLSGSVGILQTSVLVMIVVIVVSHIVLSRTQLGMHIYAVGGNAQAARVAGVKVRVVQAGVYAISGLLAAVSGVLLASRVTAGIPTTGAGYELNAIAAAVIGGISLSGGRGSIKGTCFGILIIGIMDNGLNIMNVSPFYQNIVKGGIIICAVFIDVIVNKKSS
ncbi:ribose/xylose/arabinose/galactoside ABC-type transport system permease subunit [Paraburkholderia sp. GAS199]|uniref:ABC transporter permease n=1 Tax=Paraburkholderia sp. GAS199 TaxID=3035126 RepID=UPI003D25ACA7